MGVLVLGGWGGGMGGIRGGWEVIVSRIEM